MIAKLLNWYRQNWSKRLVTERTQASRMADARACAISRQPKGEVEALDTFSTYPNTNDQPPEVITKLSSRPSAKQILGSALQLEDRG